LGVALAPKRERVLRTLCPILEIILEIMLYK
jgi:hypothetical protein